MYAEIDAVLHPALVLCRLARFSSARRSCKCGCKAFVLCESLVQMCKDNGGGMAEGQEREARERHEAQLRRQQQTYEEQQHLAVLEHRSRRVHAEMQQRRARVQHGLNRL